MKGLIFNNRENALSAAQFEAISMAEKKFDVVFNNAKVIDSNAWLITGSTTQCTCGQTNCVKVTLFANDLTNAMLNYPVTDGETALIEGNTDGEQFTVAYGYCSDCGSENPMP